MASTVSLIQMLASGCLKSDGTPIASGKVRFYLPGTLTPVSVYSDISAATPITPPLTLTAGGTGIAYTKVPTRVILKDSTETTTYFDGLVNINRAEETYIQSASVNGGTETTLQTLLDGIGTSFGGTAGLWKFKAGTGGTERNYVDVINDFGISVKSFGATGGGAVDDYAAIQNAINFVASLGGGNVLFPPGTYLCSATLSVTTAGVDIVGAGASASIIKTTGAGVDGLTFAVASGGAVLTNRVSTIQITHSTTSTAAAVSQSSLSSVLVDRCILGGGTFRTGFSSTATSVLTVIQGSYLLGRAADASSVGINLAGGVTTVTSSFASGATAGLQVSSGDVSVTGSRIFGTTAGLAASGVSTTVAASGCYFSGTSSVTIAAACTGAIDVSANIFSGPIADSRTGAPVSYTFAADGNFTPLPLQARAIRVNVTAAAVVTINAATVAGFGPKFSLMLCRSTASAVTWTFNAQYILQGGAAPAPTNGNMMISVFEYDPISSKYRETSRSASMAI